MSQDAVQERPGGPSYPFGAIEPGETTTIADGVIWARLAAPFAREDGADACDHVNVYFLRDEDGWTLVDTGVGDAGTEEQLAALIARTLEGASVKRVICTHMHPRHIGQAGWLGARHGAVLWMSQLEYLLARVLVADRPPPAAETIGFLLATGWEQEWIDAFAQSYGAFARSVRPLPRSFVRIEDRADITIGARVWRVITGAGASPEHVCLWQPELKLFITGRQVTPKIAPDIIVRPLEPAANPLKDWLLSCWRIMAAIPDDVLVLPGRDAPFHGLHERLDALIEEPEPRLARLKDALDRPRRVVDVFGAALARELRPAERAAATGVALAHLNYLRAKGQVRYAIDEAGVAWFELDPDAGPEDDDDI